MTSEAPKDLDTIWQTFIDANLEWDGGGDPLGALNWRIAGIYIPDGREEFIDKRTDRDADVSP